LKDSNEEIVKLLLEKDVDVNFVKVVKNCNAKIVKYLLEKRC